MRTSQASATANFLLCIGRIRRFLFRILFLVVLLLLFAFILPINALLCCLLRLIVASSIFLITAIGIGILLYLLVVVFLFCLFVLVVIILLALVSLQRCLDFLFFRLVTGNAEIEVATPGTLVRGTFLPAVVAPPSCLLCRSSLDGVTLVTGHRSFLVLTRDL